MHLKHSIVEHLRKILAMVSNTILELPKRDPDMPPEARLKWLTHLIGTLFPK